DVDLAGGIQLNAGLHRPFESRRLGGHAVVTHWQVGRHVVSVSIGGGLALVAVTGVVDGYRSIRHYSLRRVADEASDLADVKLRLDERASGDSENSREDGTLH